jgi:hypothetical protein
MNEWTLHWLEAAGDLQPWRKKIEAETLATRAAVSGLVEPPRLDVLIGRSSVGVIPEIGIGGRAYGKNLFSLTVDPDNPAFQTCLMDGTLRRQVSHEVNHCLRMAGPGYGRTFGEALVSEGLAGHFVRVLFNNPPEPWERAVDRAALLERLPDAEALSATQWDHAAWFFGALDGQFPRWFGYTLGYELVGAWASTVQTLDGKALALTPASEIIAAGTPLLSSI